MSRLLLTLAALSTLAALAHAAAAVAFDDARSRHAFFPVAAAAYNDEPLGCLKARYGNVEVVGKYLVPCDAKDNCFGYVALAHDEKAILIGYRGSTSALQLIYEGAGSVLHKHASMFDGKVLVSEYFLNAFNVTWTGSMEAAVRDLITNPKYDDYEIRISGHSLGGAVSVIAATYIAHEYPAVRPRIAVHTFGQPRVGDFAFALYHNSLVAQTFRVTHHRDLVPAIPPLSFKNYYHSKTEVFYDLEGMGPGAHYTECASGETLGCLLGKLGTSIKDHLSYYETEVSGHGRANCPTAV